MKHTPIKKTIFALGLAALNVNSLFADTPTTANLTGDAVSGSTLYVVNPGSIILPVELVVSTDPNQLINALDGDVNFAGGNIELYAASDGADLASFQNAQHVELALTFANGNQVTVSSLNGQDWFSSSSTGYDTTWGAENLANTWFNDFVDELDTFPSLAAYTTDRQSLFESFRDSGGFQQQSDPNISYVEASGNTVTVGLGGFIDIKDRVTALVSNATGIPEAIVASQVPNGIQSSEVVLINGVASYGFEAVTSGVFVDDGVNSYNGTYVVSQSVPEPSSAVLFLLGAGAVTLRRKR